MQRLITAGTISTVSKKIIQARYGMVTISIGDLVHVSVLGQHIIHVNSAQAAADLFDRRATTYSDRPHSVMMNDL